MLSVQNCERHINMTNYDNLQENAGLYAALFYSSPVAQAVFDGNGIITAANRSFCSMTGIDDETAAGTPLASLIADGNRQNIQHIYQSLAKDSDSTTAELAATLNNGNPLSACITAVQTGNGKSVSNTPHSIQYLCTIRAYHPLHGTPGKRKQTADHERHGRERHVIDTQDLKISQDKVSAILKNAPIGICITNEKGYFEYVNSTYCRLYGYSEEELLGRHFTLVVPEKDREELSHLHDRFIGGYNEMRGEWEVVGKHGKHISILADAGYFEDTDGRGRKVTFVVDVTAKHNLELFKEDVNRILRHDLKTPLNLIIGYPQLLRDFDGIDPRQRKYINLIESAGRRMLEMIEIYLNTFTIESGQYVLNTAPVDITAVISGAFKELEQRFMYKNVSFSIQDETGDGGAAPESVRVKGEKTLCYGIVSNLLRNAAEASPNDATVHISIKSSGDFIRISVHNAGAVPVGIRDTFFEKYITSGKQGGTGLGTYIALIMTEIQGGTIEMTTDERTGTTVTFSLPTY